MDNSVVGVIAAGVVCGVLFIATVAIICFLLYRCRRYEDEKSSQHAPLMNGHVANGGIPTVAALVPVPSPTRHLYQFPTMPVRHMASYRPRYIEERKPEGHSIAVRAHTYAGGYSKGPVFYDVRQHGGYRAYREPVWAQKGQEEAEATMVLGEESPKSEHHFVVEENNNNETSVKRETSVKSNTEESVGERRSFRTQDIKLPSPDEARRSYLFTSEPEEPTVGATNEDTREPSERDSGNYSQLKVIRESRRQRRGEEGIVHHLPKHPKPSSRQPSRPEPTPQEPMMAVYIPDAHPDSIPEESGGYIQRYFINDDVYTVSSPNQTEQGEQLSNSNGLHVIGHSVGQPEFISDERGSRTTTETDFIGPPISPYGDFHVNGRALGREHSHKDYRVIKSKRRPSWLQNAGQWFSKKRNK